MWAIIWLISKQLIDSACDENRRIAANLLRENDNLAWFVGERTRTPTGVVLTAAERFNFLRLIVNRLEQAHKMLDALTVYEGIVCLTNALIFVELDELPSVEVALAGAQYRFRKAGELVPECLGMNESKLHQMLEAAIAKLRSKQPLAFSTQLKGQLIKVLRHAHNEAIKSLFLHLSLGISTIRVALMQPNFSETVPYTSMGVDDICRCVDLGKRYRLVTSILSCHTRNMLGEGLEAQAELIRAMEAFDSIRSNSEFGPDVSATQVLDLLKRLADGTRNVWYHKTAREISEE